MLKKLLMTTALAALPVLASIAPANALLQIAFHDSVTNTTQSIADGGFGDFAGATGNLITLNTVVGGFTVFGTLSVSSTGHLSMSSFGINNGGIAGTLSILVGDTGFGAPVAAITESGALTFHNNLGALASNLQFFAGNGNAQPSFLSPGTSLFNTSGTPTSVDDSFSGTALSLFASGSPFAMAELANFNMLNGSSITGFEQSMTTQVAAVPEASTWAMMLLGFASVGLFGIRKRRQLRLA